MPTPDPIAALSRAVGRAAAAATGLDLGVELAAPASPEHGDLATPVAMAAARSARRSPREIAEDIRAALLADADLADVLEQVEVAGPGFLNLRLAPAWYAAALHDVLAAGERFGAGQASPPRTLLVEFVSPNPTGPLHVGHARNAAYGDSLARILEIAGHDVWREAYMNDHGRQLALFGQSVAVRYAELTGRPGAIPEDGYRGEYVVDIAERIRAEVGDAWADRVSPPSAEAVAFFGARGAALVTERLVADLERFRVRFDRLASERELHETGRVAEHLAELEARGEAYRRDGALWFRSSRHGDEKDRVLVRADGTPTYLAADVAYHLDKAARGRDLMIDVLGADHHGYIGRLRAVLASAGYDPDTLEVLITQLVSLVERGEARRMSKRAGNLVELGELVDDIGVDAARFLLVQRSHDTAFELDMDLARKTNDENPVFYVQYVHARICSILARPEIAGVAAAGPPAQLHPAERALVLRVAGWPDVLREAEARRAPHRVAGALVEIARDYHAFYHDCPILKTPLPTHDVQAFRLDLCRATASVVRAGLGLVGVSAPESM